MKTLLSILTRGWFLGLVGVLFLIVLVWFLGPLIGFGDVRPLEGIAARLVVALVLLLIWALLVLIGVWRRHRRQAALVEGMTQNAGADSGGADAGPEVEALRQGLQSALTDLQRMRRKDGKGGRRYLYELPWYLIIGPPGAGKTTALANSGLGFPLGKDGERAKIAGAGGTRHCDWWFTDEAVLLDTAGRYTTQDSQAATDAAAWEGFVDILRKTRPRQPVNGLLVAISLSDIMTASESERREHALAIRKRISELYDRLGLRLPVYVMLTKVDLVAGFMEFFADLRRDGRAQVWGMTFPMAETRRGEVVSDPLDSFGDEFDLLLERLEQHRLDRLHQEDDFARAGLISGFPLQVAALREPVAQLLEQAFRAGRYEDPVMLRGVYFTSGTQEGTPIDRVMAGLANRFGVPPARFGAFRGQGRSYFLTRLLREVIFGEAGLVGRNRRTERRMKLVRGLALGTAAVLLVTGAGLWTWSTLVNLDLIKGVEDGLDRYRAHVQQIRPDDGGALVVESSDLRPILPALAALRDLPTGYAERDRPAPMGSGFGLYQGAKLAQQTQSAYRDGLNSLLLPRLTYRVREMLLEAEELESLYGLLKIYLMLGGQGPMDPALIRQWTRLDIARRHGGGRNEALRAEIAGHVAALTDGLMKPMPMDGPLIQRTRDTLKQQPMAESAYALIRDSAAARALPDWRIIDAAGPSGPRVFTRRSGASLNEGVDGFYTYRGFSTVFLPYLVDAADEIASNSWVMGDQEVLDEAGVRRLERDLAALYLDDYVAVWDTLLADIVLKPFENSEDALTIVGLLSGANSPLRNLLEEVSQQTRLARPEDQSGGALGALAAGGLGAVENAEGVEEAAGQARQVGQALGLGTGRLSTVERLAGIFSDSGLTSSGGRTGGAGGGGGDTALPGQFVNDRFARLHAFVRAPDGGTPPLETTIDQLERAYDGLRRVADSGGNLAALSGVGAGGGGGGSGVDAIRRLDDAAEQAPAPLSGWLEHIATGGQTIAVGSTRTTLGDAWKADVLPLCREALNGRYPFAGGSQREVALADFTRLFSPGGLIDGFFRNNLLPYVDLGSKPWRSRRHNGIDLNLSRATLAQFERAAAIRDAFFPTGAAQLNVPFQVTPVALDPAANQVVLEIAGQTVSYGHGPVTATAMQWPGPGTRSRIAFQPSEAGGQSMAIFEGPWSFFRLLDQARRQGGGTGDRFRAVFSSGGRTATFEIRAGSVMNPFNLPELRAFRCPGTL